MKIRKRETLKSAIKWLAARAAELLLRFAAVIDDGFPNRAILVITRRDPGALKKYVQEQATNLAGGILMAMLDREGLVHCHLCPQRFSLRKVGGHYACLNHSKEVGAKEPVAA